MIRPVLVTLLVAPLLHAATYLVPGDAELIQSSDEIVVVTGVAAHSERNARGAIVTRYTVRVEETLKGQTTPGAHLVLTELGGVVGGRARIIPGSPRYETGARYLVFTSTNRDLEPATYGLSLGQFALEHGHAIRRGIHGFDHNLDSHVERSRDAQLFTRYIRDLVAHRFSPADYFTAARAAEAIEPNVLNYSRYSFLLDEGAVGYRWVSPTVDWVRNGTQPGSDGAAAVAMAFGQWNTTDSSIDYRDIGVDATALGGTEIPDGKNTVLFNDPNNEITEPSVVGRGGAFREDDLYSLDGETFWAIVEADVVIAHNSFSQNCLDTIVTHELGHTLGIRHSNSPPTGTACGTTAKCTTDAIMNASVSCAWKGILRPWDEEAAASVYGDGLDCVNPAIVEQPVSMTVRRGEGFRVEVTASGSEPLRYEWFEGERGVTTHPVGNDSRRLIIAAGREATTTFWVRVSNTCESVDSEAATVTVIVPARRRTARH